MKMLFRKTSKEKPGSRAWYGGKTPPSRESLDEAIAEETASERVFALEPGVLYGSLTGSRQSIRGKMADSGFFEDWTPERGFYELYYALHNLTSSLNERLHILGKIGRFRLDSSEPKEEIRAKIQAVFPSKVESAPEEMADLARKLQEVWEPLSYSALDFIIHHPENVGRLLADRLDPDEASPLYIIEHSFEGADGSVLQAIAQTRTVAYERPSEIHLIGPIRDFLDSWDRKPDGSESGNTVTLFETLLLHELVEVVLDETADLNPLSAHIIASMFEHCLRDEDLSLAVKAFFQDWYQLPDDIDQGGLGDREAGIEGLPQPTDRETAQRPDRQRHYVFESLDASKQSVLVIDDSSMIRHLIRKVVERVGAQIIEAEDGVEGMTLARHHKPDLIILDVYMAEKGGLQTLKELRTDSQLKFIPVIMLTIEDNTRVVREALDWKADDYLIKPITPRKLRERLGKFLGKK